MARGTTPSTLPKKSSGRGPLVHLLTKGELRHNLGLVLMPILVNGSVSSDCHVFLYLFSIMRREITCCPEYWHVWFQGSLPGWPGTGVLKLDTRGPVDWNRRQDHDSQCIYLSSYFGMNTFVLSYFPSRPHLRQRDVHWWNDMGGDHLKTDIIRRTRLEKLTCPLQHKHIRPSFIQTISCNHGQSGQRLVMVGAGILLQGGPR